MKVGLRLVIAAVLVATFLGSGSAVAAAPPAPTSLSPATGASVLTPFTISWSAVSYSAGIVAYNWQVSPASSFSPVILQDSTDGAIQDTVSGLANGAYFWRVQAVGGDFTQGAWSSTRSFTVTGAGPSSPGTPTLSIALANTTQFHPFESIPFRWTAAAGAARYVFEAAKNSSFPVATTIRFDNIPSTATTLTIGDFCGGCEQGTYVARVYAVNANGIAGAPSKPVAFSISYNAPLPPPPSPLAPANGATVTLPVTLDWSDVPNPQPSGYEVEISRNASFTDIEEHIPQLNESTRVVLSLTSGAKFWHVRSAQGDASPTTAAFTAWSSTRSFIVSAAPPTVASVSSTNPSPFSGASGLIGELQLTGAAPSGGATVSLTSTNASAVTVPSTVSVPIGVAYAQFQFQVGQVTAPTSVTVRATLGSSSASFTITVQPPSLKQLAFPPTSAVTGGAPASGFLMLNGVAPPAGATISLASNSLAVSPPATVTVASGDTSVWFTAPTRAVTATTTATVTASWQGVSIQAQLTLTPQQPPAALTLDPTSTTGATGSTGRVALAATTSTDVQILLSSSNPAVASVPPSVTIPAFAAASSFAITTSAVSTPTTVTISAAGAGVTKTAVLTVNPVPSAPLPAPTLLSPAASARFSVGQRIVFDWSDVSGAGSYTMQISTTSSFSSTVVNQTLTASQFATATLPKADLFWRVRANDPSGNPGAWSSARAVRVN